MLANWPNDKALTNEALRKIRESEYVEAFRGRAVADVFKAVGEAILGAVHGAPPSIGNIAANLPKPTETRPSDRYGYRQTYDYSVIPDRIRHTDWGRRLMYQNCSPGYILFHEKDRALTAEAFAKAKNLPDDEVCFGKTVRRAVAQLEE